MLVLIIKWEKELQKKKKNTKVREEIKVEVWKEKERP